MNCGDCLSDTMVNGTCRLCGWKEPQAKQAQPELKIQVKEYIPDELIQVEKERIAELRANNENWTEIIKQEVRDAVKKPTKDQDKEQKRRIVYHEIQKQLAKLPSHQDIRTVCKSMPAPNVSFLPRQEKIKELHKSIESGKISVQEAKESIKSWGDKDDASKYLAALKRMQYAIP